MIVLNIMALVARFSPRNVESMKHWLSFLIVLLALAPGIRWTPAGATQSPVTDIGARLELFVDRQLVDSTRGVTFELQRPVAAEKALIFDKPWEGAFVGYCTVIRDGAVYRLYYRGLPMAKADGSESETTCYAESRDGINWTKPALGLFDVMGTRENNVILADSAPLSHNFSPLLDARPGVPAAERFKALAGTKRSGLFAFASADGVRWRKFSERPVLTQGDFDSQNLAFWSESEGLYVCYLRVFKRIDGKGVRWVARATSTDFLHWSDPVEMSFGDAPPEHLYTNQTHPYFRAPHIYLGIAARFMPGRQVLTEAQARAVNVDPGYFKDISDSVLLSSRGGARYDRSFLEALIKPEIGWEHWTSRTNYPALNIVPTGPNEMSFYVQKNYGQPTHHLQRYVLRTDGLVAVRAPYAGGELVTKPLKFAGKRLLLNFATSAAGGVRVEVQDAAGRPLPGCALTDAVEQIGNEIERAVAWRAGEDISALAGQTVRLRFVMKDAELFSFRFR
ncbi:MAG: hypothetical protein SF339_00180 [Blastocatellia bacterium]|nr:hypothetical protein [Blastocatellia bacterium]